MSARLFTRKLRWARWDLNPEPRDYESPALTIELQALNQLWPDNL